MRSTKSNQTTVDLATTTFMANYYIIIKIQQFATAKKEKVWKVVG
jgi:hypothetical protein